jgi:Tfp pilus assembly protein PilO
MNASRREIQLGVATAVVLLGALTWWMLEDNIKVWGELGEKAQTLERMLAKQERNAARKPELIRQLDEIKSLLPVHAEDLDLKPRMLQQLKQTADAQKIVLSSMRPKDEKVAPQTGLSEQSIDCAFEGEFPDWVRFLYDIEAQGPIMAVSKISVRSDQKAGRLKGSLTVDFAYARGIEPERKPPVNPGVPPEPRVVDTPAPAPEPPSAVTNNVPVASTNAPAASPSVPAVPAIPAMPGVPAMPGSSEVVTDLPSVNPASAFPSPGTPAPSPAPATPARAAPPGVPAFPVPGPPLTNRIIRINRPRPASPMPTLPAPAPSPAPAPAPALPQP